MPPASPEPILRPFRPDDYPKLLEVWRERSQTPARRAENCFLALAGDEWVGLTELLLSDQPTHLRTGLTGVRRGWRGRGIATALKLMALGHSKRQDATEVTTSNHQANRAMLGINERLGFVKQPANIDYHKALRSETRGGSQ